MTSFQRPRLGVSMWAVARLKPEERLVITLMELEEKSVLEETGHER
jgi:hypothetical protein